MDILLKETASMPSLKIKMPCFMRRARLGNLRDMIFSK